MINFIEQFERAFYYSPIGMAILSLEGQCLKVNPSLSKMTGYTEEELLTTVTFRDISHPDDFEEETKLMQQLIEGKKESYEIEIRYFHKNGDLKWELISVSIVKDGGEALFIIAQVQDITERKQLELKLMESEERLNTLITHIPDPVIVHDGETILFANPSAANLVGTSLEGVNGSSIEEFIHPDHMEFAREIIKGILEDGEPYHNFDLKIRSKSGEPKDAILSAIPIMYMNKKAIMVSYRDITERKKVQKALKESEERYRMLIEYSPLGILLYQNRIIQFANSMAIQLLGAQNADELIGRSIYQLIHPDYQKIASKRDESIESGEIAPTVYEKFIRLDGKEIDVEVNGIPIQSNGESAVQIVFWDVTEKKKEEDLVRYRAYHDTLTDLPNRLKFQIDLEEVLKKDTPFSIMYLDLHGLKPVNDTLGHQAGDMVLMKVSSRLSGVLDPVGRVYRIGGDEFTVLLPGDKSIEEVVKVIHTMDENLKKPIYLSNNVVQVTASFGVVLSAQNDGGMDSRLSNADTAMYYAKKNNLLYKIFESN
ncbi:PAS domain S-box protein [Ureibacillus sp. MALMAid1270]|uniref:PAS domain S-box protein n=1 Tax=Ureibacillus sp. MALMAid1270 TaxID=3411629 RepID=UPI003BA472B0